MESDPGYDLDIIDCYLRHIEDEHFRCRLPWNKKVNSGFPDKLCDQRNDEIVQNFARIVMEITAFNDDQVGYDTYFKRVPLYLSNLPSKFIDRTHCVPRCQASLYSVHPFGKEGKKLTFPPPCS